MFALAIAIVSMAQLKLVAVVFGQNFSIVHPVPDFDGRQNDADAAECHSVYVFVAPVLIDGVLVPLAAFAMKNEMEMHKL